MSKPGIASRSDQPYFATSPHPARLNLAHAYLFNNQFEKAEAIYAKYLGTAFEDGRKWNDELRSDFKLLREVGHDHPDMQKIEGLLGEGM